MARPLDGDLQGRILKAIKDFWDENHYSPSLLEIVDMAGISSTSVVSYHVRRLASKKVIRFTPRKARSIVVLKETTIQ